MCNDLRRSKRKSAIVFKIVAKSEKDMRYYSLAMGFKYPKKAGKIPKINVQHRIAHYFSENILNKESIAYEKQMIGRTAGFVKEEDAKYRVSVMEQNVHKLDIIILKAKLTEGLMLGDYGHAPVIAGKHIEFLE